MKVALTGHSKGIGAALARTLTDQGHVVVGYDLINNYDITRSGVIDTIAAQSVECDVFINNAYADISQTLMLEAMIAKWEHTTTLKTIVNISSKMSLVKNIDSQKNLIYKHNKIIQNKITKSRINILQPQILNIIPGGNKIESILHNRFKDKRQIGEWFEKDDEILECFKEFSKR